MSPTPPHASLGEGAGRGQGAKNIPTFQKAGPPPPSPTHTHPGCPFSPDVQTAEGGKENPRGKGQGDGQEQGQELVNHEFADLEEGMAADPHVVEGVRGLGLRDHVLEVQLRDGDAELSPNLRPGTPEPQGGGSGTGGLGRGAPPSPGAKVGAQKCGEEFLATQAAPRLVVLGPRTPRG